MNVVHTVSGRFPGKKLKGKDRYKRLYHFTSFDTFEKIWLGKQLKFGEISNVNDIQEANFNVLVLNVQQASLIHLYRDIRKSYKQISLTMDYDSYIRGSMSSMMWGIYGDKRKGVCIELDYDKLCLPKGALSGMVFYKHILDYGPTLPYHLETINDVEKFIIRNKKNIFFTKQKSWSGENEYRILSRDNDFLDISDAITAVYLTSNDSEECLQTEKLVNEIVPVKYLKFKPSQDRAIPVLIDTKSSRMQYADAKINPENALKHITSQSKARYEELKGDKDSSLLLSSYTFPK